MSYKPNTGFPWSDSCPDITSVNGDAFDLDCGKVGQILYTRTSGTGTVTFQGANDESYTNIVAIPAYNASTGASATTTTSAGSYIIIPTTRYVRARVTTYTSGTFSGNYTITEKELIPPVCQSSTVVQSISAGTTLIGDVSEQVRASATGGASVKHVVSAASTNAGIIKASAGRVVGWSLANNTASWQYLKLYNIATSPTVGTTAVYLTIAIPPNNISQMAINTAGISFATGIGMSITTGATDSDATATTAAGVVGDIFFA